MNEKTNDQTGITVSVPATENLQLPNNPEIGDSVQETSDESINDELVLADDSNPDDVAARSDSGPEMPGETPRNQSTTEDISEETELSKLIAVCSEVNDNLKTLTETVALSGKRFNDIESNLSQLSHQVSYLPPQIKIFGRKIETLSTSISESKYNNLLKSLLMIYDLVEQSLISLNSEKVVTTIDDHRRSLDVLKTQLLQTFEINGLTQIPAVGDKYDPKIHKALKVEPVEKEEENGINIHVLRPGFRTESQVLRYSDVVVGKYIPQEQTAVTGTETGSCEPGPADSNVSDDNTEKIPEKSPSENAPPAESSEPQKINNDSDQIKGQE